MQNLFIDSSKTSVFSDGEKFSANIFEESGLTNSNNATNLKQLYNEETYNKNITHDKYFYLDGKTAFSDGVSNADGSDVGLKLLSRNYSGETEDIVGWMTVRSATIKAISKNRYGFCIRLKTTKV